MIKYLQLQDKLWLSQKYETEKLTTQEIATEINCDKSSVRNALIKNGIFLRKAKESISIKRKKSGRKSDFPQLNDKEWLINKYVKNGCTCLDIRDELGISQTITVVKALANFGIKRRTDDPASFNSRRFIPQLHDYTWLSIKLKDGASLEDIAVELGVDNKTVSHAIRKLKLQTPLEKVRSDEEFVLDTELIDASLIGDGTLRCGVGKIKTATFSKTNKFQDHVEWVSKQLFNDKTNRINLVYQHCNGKQLVYYGLATLNHTELYPILERWYPETNDCKKLIPRDISVSAKFLLHWYLDDGSCSFRKRDGVRCDGTNGKAKQLVLTFSSESFTKKDQQWLANRINEKFDLGMRVITCNTGTGYRLKIPQTKIAKFYGIIGPPPVASLAYKWK